MKLSRLLASLVLLSFALLAGCSGSSTNPPPPPPGASQVTLAMTDAPPPGVTVLSFEVSVTSAVLNPGNVDLLAGRGPIQIEVKRLETEAAFLSTVGVAPGTYNSITIGLANPELTIKNDGAPGIPGCAVNAVCEFKPAVSANVTFSGAPFPVTVSSNSPFGLLIDLNLNNIISGALGVDFNAAGSVVVSQLNVQQPTGQLEELEDLVGIVKNKDAANNRFELELAPGRRLTILVDSNTQFEDFNEINPPCQAVPQNFTCVLNDQMAEVDVRIMAAGTLLAKKVEAEDEVDLEEELEGIIVSIASPPDSFEMVVTDDIRNVPGVEVGQRVRVNLRPATQFRIDDDGLPNINSADFDTRDDLLVGQKVEVERKTAPSGAPPAFETDKVKLKRSSFTAKVKTKIDANTFTVDNLPSLFGSATPAITEVEVRTSAATRFQDVANVAALNTGDIVSLRGLLFKRAGSTPFMVAKRVRKRP